MILYANGLRAQHHISGKTTFRTLCAPAHKVRESRPPGSVRGASSNGCPYRDKVSNREGIANQTGSESCVAHREVRDEALTGEPAGQPLSRESFKLVQGADAVSVAEGNTERRDTLAVEFSFYVEAIFPVGIDVRVACWPETRNISGIDTVALRF